MYQDTILKFIDLKQAHTDTMFNIKWKNIGIAKFEMLGEFFCQNYFKIKKV